MKKEWIYIQVVYADTHEEAIDQVIGGEIDMTHELNARVIEPEHLMSVMSAYLQDKEDAQEPLRECIVSEAHGICPSRDDAQPHIFRDGRCVMCYAPIK